MPRRRIAMYKIEEVLRLTYAEGRRQREVGRACGLSQSGESKVLKRAREAVLSWPLPEGQGRAAGLRERGSELKKQQGDCSCSGRSARSSIRRAAGTAISESCTSAGG